MNILLINISLRPESKRKIFPIGLGHIATAINLAGFDFDLLDIDAYKMSDFDVNKRMATKQYDVICLGCLVSGYSKAKALMHLARKMHPDATIIVGNSIASSIIDTLFKNTEANVAVLGEGDITIVELLNAIQHNSGFSDIRGIVYKDGDKIVKTVSRPAIENISDIPIINHDLFDIEQYLKASRDNVNESIHLPDNIKTLPIASARGCIAKCTFCYHVFKDMKYRYKIPQRIAEEIIILKQKYGVNYIQFLDDLTFFSKTQVESFVDLLLSENLNIKWSATCRSNLFISDYDEPIIQKMALSGCEGMQFSLESSDPEILKAMNKKCSVKHFSKQAELYQKNNITTWTSLVFGYPQETKQTIENTIDVCIENNIYPSVGFLLPQPGSVMYEYARSHGFIRDEEEYLLTTGGDRQDLIINLTTMADEEFIENVISSLRKCNEALKVGLDDGSLIKTRAFKKNST